MVTHTHAEELTVMLLPGTIFVQYNFTTNTQICHFEHRTWNHKIINLSYIHVLVSFLTYFDI